MKPLATYNTRWPREMSVTDSFSFSLSHISFLTKWKRKKKSISRYRHTLLFLIFHMKGFYLSTGGSRNTGFVLSKCINTFAPTTASLINCNYFCRHSTQDPENKLNQMLFKVKAKAKYRTNKRKVLSGCITFSCE